MVVVVAMMMMVMVTMIIHPLHLPFALISRKIHVQHMLLQQIHFILLVSQERLKAFPSHSCKMNQRIRVVSLMCALQRLKCSKMLCIKLFFTFIIIRIYNVAF
jgi:hypothetical protein